MEKQTHLLQKYFSSKTSAGVLVCLILFSLAILLVALQKQYSLFIPQPVVVIKPYHISPMPTTPPISTTPTPTYAPITYLTYTNPSLGIQIQYPSVGINKTACVANPTIEGGKPIITLNDSDTPTQIIEDLPNHGIYLTFARDGFVEWNNNSQMRAYNTNPNACHVANVDLNYVTNGINTGEPGSTHYVYFTRYDYTPVHTDQDIKYYLDNKFGAGCYEMSKTLLDGQTNAYTVTVRGVFPPKSYCYQMENPPHIIYSLAKGLIVVWSEGEQQPAWQYHGQSYPSKVNFLP